MNHRAPIPPAALIAAYRAHKTDTHHGHIDGRCPTCTRYALALLITTRPARQERP